MRLYALPWDFQLIQINASNESGISPLNHRLMDGIDKGDKVEYRFAGGFLNVRGKGGQIAAFKQQSSNAGISLDKSCCYFHDLFP